MITPTDFDRLYARNADPFRVADSWYEQRKIAVVLSVLAHERYRRAWDAACGTGHLAAALAQRSRYLMATDAAPTACTLTRDRLAGITSAEIRVHHLPELPPESTAHPFDLVVLSEVLYYLSPAELDRMPQMLTSATCSDTAEIVAVNWRHHPEDAYLSGVAAVELLGRALRELGWQSTVRHDDEDFVLGSWQQVNGAIS